MPGPYRFHYPATAPESLKGYAVEFTLDEAREKLNAMVYTPDDAPAADVSYAHGFADGLVAGFGLEPGTGRRMGRFPMN